MPTIFETAARENTGKSMLDSGGENGRHWQKPPLAEARPLVVWDKYGAAIETAAFLAEHLRPAHDVQAQFEEFAQLPENEREDWFTVTERFREHLGLESLGRDNVYNGENDLSQVYIYDVWGTDDTRRDWIYADDDRLTVIHIHTGADVRGGYGRPIFCRARGEYQVPVDLVAEFTVIEARGPDGTPLSDDKAMRLSERWIAGYSGHPQSAMERDVERFFEFTRTVDTCCALLKSGEVVKISAYAPGCY